MRDSFEILHSIFGIKDTSELLSKVKTSERLREG